MQMTPDGAPLQFLIQCRSSRDASKGAKHLVSIDRDWTVTTPHDLEAERVAAAFGGYSSCLDLVDQTVPVFRKALGILMRRSRLALVKNARGGWRLPTDQQAENCCRGRKFTSIKSAAQHSRDPGHLARRYGVPRWQLSALASAARKAWGALSKDTAPLNSEAASLVREQTAIDDLWAAGIHPSEIPEMAAAVSIVQSPLPISYFLGMAYGNAEPDWIKTVIEFRPDPDTAAWLAWLDNPSSKAPPSMWGQWLHFGLPRADVLFAIESHLAPESVFQVGALTGWSESKSAKHLIGWAQVGCYPTAAHFRLLLRNRVEYAQPSRAAINDLTQEVERRSLLVRPTRNSVTERTSLGVLLAVLGTRRDVIHAITSGIRSFDEIESFLYPHDVEGPNDY